jgi:hypothetical protein
MLVHGLIFPCYRFERVPACPIQFRIIVMHCSRYMYTMQLCYRSFAPYPTLKVFRATTHLDLLLNINFWFETISLWDSLCECIIAISNSKKFCGGCPGPTPLPPILLHEHPLGEIMGSPLYTSLGGHNL